MAGTIEFKVGGVDYRASPMDARRQLHIATKVMGVVGSFGEFSNPLMALSKLDQNDLDFVVNECLRVTERQEEGATVWAPVMTAEGLIMYSDLKNSLAKLLQIVIPVLEASVGDFLSELPKDYIANLITRVMGKVSNSQP